MMFKGDTHMAFLLIAYRYLIKQYNTNDIYQIFHNIMLTISMFCHSTETLQYTKVQTSQFK